jgi:hypothetical protein
MANESANPEQIKEISDRLLSKHNERLNRDFATIFGRSRKEHHPITSNAEDWLKPKEKPNG